jgi:hypothetical protein
LKKIFGDGIYGNIVLNILKCVYSVGTEQREEMSEHINMHTTTQEFCIHVV